MKDRYLVVTVDEAKTIIACGGIHTTYEAAQTEAEERDAEFRLLDLPVHAEVIDTEAQF